MLAEALPSFIAGFKFAKSMRWNESGVAFSRPIRWIVALFGETVIPFDYAGVSSGRVTCGLRPYGSPEISLKDAAAYRVACAEQGIILDYEQRNKDIRKQIEYQVTQIWGRDESRKMCISEDEDLLAEVTNLVEAPTAFWGILDEVSIRLPRAVLKTVLRKHQRCFAVVDDAGNPYYHFIGVRNGDREHIAKVREGNEAVMRARFADALFFYNSDRQQPLSDFMPRLDTLTFQAELGSMREKNDRVAASVAGLGLLLRFDADTIEIAERAAAIAKADLATSMVVEMTSLQGVMGREYALRDGAEPAVAQAIFEHWLPRGAADILPASDAGRLLAIADKLDSLVGLFAVGLAPKSTSDPYGLRRNALGIIQILLDQAISIDLRALIRPVAAAQPVAVDAAVRKQVVEFLGRRLDNLLNEDFAFRRDVVRAVLREQAHDPARALQGVRELDAWVKRADWEAILDAFARCARITRGEDEQAFSPKLLRAEQEKSLFDRYQSALAEQGDADTVDAFLGVFASLVPAVTAFFDNVLVHTDDVALRNNRIALLQKIAAMQNGRADLRELENF